jgi:hypothetical protein
MTVVFEVNGAKFAAMMLDPKAFVTAHKLRVEVTGIVGGKKQTFKGKSLLHVFYKTAMIVPSGHAKDPALVVLPKWAQQWKAHESSVRTIVSLPSIPAVTGKITPASYNPLIAAVTKAAKAAPHGIVALAVGHGDAGNPNQTNPWCDLVAEDGKIDDETYDRGLFIDDLELKDGEPEPGPIKTTPGGRTMVKLDALDRMADVFAKHPIRALLLHTCSAGAAPKFIQRSCNRVRVFVRAHTQQIEYTGNTAGSIEASYAGEAAGPNAKHEWPVAHVTREFAPTTPPPERFPL